MFWRVRKSTLMNDGRGEIVCLSGFGNRASMGVVWNAIPSRTGLYKKVVTIDLRALPSTTYTKDRPLSDASVMISKALSMLFTIVEGDAVTGLDAHSDDT